MPIWTKNGEESFQHLVDLCHKNSCEDQRVSSKVYLIEWLVRGCDQCEGMSETEAYSNRHLLWDRRCKASCAFLITPNQFSHLSAPPAGGGEGREAKESTVRGGAAGWQHEHAECGGAAGRCRQHQWWGTHSFQHTLHYTVTLQPVVSHTGTASSASVRRPCSSVSL